MGFALVACGVFPPRAILLLLLLLDVVRFIVCAFFFYVGLSPSSERPEPLSWEDIALIFNISPSEPTEPSASSIKSQLAVSEFACVSRRCPEMFKEGEAMCIVCLGNLDGKDEVRELGNCCHAFHKDCIDKWVDIGRTTCPTCRSQLLPSVRRGGLWGLLRVFGIRVC